MDTLTSSETSSMLELKQFYNNYFKNMAGNVDNIDHVPDEIIESLSKGSTIIIEEKSNYDNINFFKESDVISKDQKETSEMASKVILCINGENATCMHIRHTLLQYNMLEVEEELHFVGVVCMKFKKSSAIWSYRRSLIEYIAKKGKTDMKSLLQNENSFLLRFLAKHPRNYHGWTHKIRLLKQWQEFYDMSNEITWVQQYIERNVHEYSAFNYLFFIINSYDHKSGQSVLEWAEKMRETYNHLYLQEEPFGEIDYSKLVSLNKFIHYLNKSINSKDVQ